ncbi:MAG: chromosome segregation protein SMC [Thermoleophilia bacterium]|nr:chromosome segregation protein SMC [Thermoleophilia bacterium]
MFLKSVKARGFKSFGRPVEFGFEPGITVVVGPNGSGKSNIADAVLWAMGEQSPSALRGASMQDVIFTGSDKLSPAGMAEVEIVFDNNSGQIPIEFSEVALSRRVYRDGESSYFINRSACRLIDIAELLSDAGLGRDSHSIISQGKVDSILESKPIERRAHIEEAAGLGKFKKRRRRAELKLDAVRRNLERLADVEEEVKAQLRPLKKQATAAERSAKLDLQIARAKTRLLKGRLEILNSELEGAQDASRTAGERRAQLEAELARTAGRRRQTEELLTESLTAHKQLADRYYSLKSKRDTLESRREAMAARREMADQGVKRAEARLQNLRGQSERVSAEMRRARSERDEGNVRLGELESELDSRQAELARVEEEINQRRHASEEKSRRVGELSALKERYAHQIEYLAQRREKIAGSMERLSGEAQAHKREYKELDETAGLEEEKLASLREKASAAGADLGAIIEQRENLENERRDLSSKLRRVAEDLQIAKARLTFIEASEDDRSGLPPAAREISLNHELKALFDLIEVEPGYEKALSAVLGSVLFALVANGIDEARQLLGEARDTGLGSIEFVLPQAGKRVENRRVGEDYLVDHVILPDVQAGFVSSLLAGVRVVDEINGLAGSSGEGIWVTREGVVYDARRRTLSYKADPPSSVVLRQRNERRQLESEREAANGKKAGIEAGIAAIDRKLAAFETPRIEAEKHVAIVSREIQAVQEHLAGIERKRHVLNQEIRIKEASHDHLLSEASRLDEELAEARRHLDEAERVLDETGSGPDGTDASASINDEALSTSRQTLAKRVTELQILAARVRERERVAALAVERTGPALNRLKRELAATAFELDAYQGLGPAAGRLQACIDRLHEVFRGVLDGLKSQLEEAEEESNHHSASLKTLSRSEAELQQSLSHASDDTTERQVTLARLRDQIGEQSEQLEAVRKKFPDADMDEEEAADAGDLEATEEHLQRLAQRRELIGPVNPLAQQEYEEMLERQNFLKEQRADLEKSLRELKGLIRDLTARIESNFAETFEAVRRNFTDVIAALFPGGEGRLTLVEPLAAAAGEIDEGQDDEDEGEAANSTGDRLGIEISVKPARKAVRSLSLLSGGERSLVAIGFLFSIFLARPAPFYILDEVEAALDDANIDRLLNMLRQYQSRTQFIVITHQKHTMEVADVLYGVSLGSDGTSKVLSRRMPPEGDETAATPARQAVDSRKSGGPADREPAAVA